MTKAIFFYTDGTIVERQFDSREDCNFFANCEGDHLEYWHHIDEDKMGDNIFDVTILGIKFGTAEDYEEMPEGTQFYNFKPVMKGLPEAPIFFIDLESGKMEAYDESNIITWASSFKTVYEASKT